MHDIAISQLTTVRWELAEDLDCLREHGFSALALWRSKLSDRGVAATRIALTEAGVRCSSLQYVGGFTGGDGRSFRESLTDAEEAIEEAAELSAPVLIVHSGCRGGHTRSHAVRLLREALEILAPVARRRGVVLALKPVHPAAACGCSFLTDLTETLDLVEASRESSIRLALDTWQFGIEAEIESLLPRLVEAVAIVQVADRWGPPTLEFDRLPPGYGGLPLESIVTSLREHGYAGDFEFDPVGETVEMLGYPGTIAEIRRVAEAWRSRRVRHGAAAGMPASGMSEMGMSEMPGMAGSGMAGFVGGGGTTTAPAVSSEPAHAAPGHATNGTRQPLHLRGGTGSRRSQASSQAVSRG